MSDINRLQSNLSCTSTLTRRDMLKLALTGTLGFLGSSALATSAEWMQDQMKLFRGQEVFARIIDKAGAEKWAALPIGEVVGKVAMELKGTPYVGFTLEASKDKEFCVVNLNGLDCVTFFEDALDMARMIKKGKSSPQDLISEIELTRYRGGKMGNFTTRLHYTTDWFYDNERKGVIKILAPGLPGAERFTQKVGIMSAHPENYRQLKAHPEWIPTIQAQEAAINSRPFMYLPMSKIKGAEPLLRTGDIIGIATTEAGIDIAHTGLCIKDSEGIVHFMDASSSRRNMKVTYETDIATCLNWSRRLTGVIFARPLEVSAV